MTFHDLGLCAPILSALNEQGYETPSPIQEKAIPPALEGRDVLGCAQTGTGKTCAFATPILQRLSAAPTSGHPIRCLILTPTRELAIQIGESFDAYGRHLKLRHTVIFGGVGQNPQTQALQRGVDILVATPGRLMDLYNQGFITLNQLEIFVLDEADRMLDMGFIHDVKKILKWLPAKKQTLFFSATMPPEITDLVNSLLKNPVRVAVNPVSSPVEAITQAVYLVDKGNKTRLLAHLMKRQQIKNALVFTRTKHGANKVARDLVKEGISAAAIHGNKSQTARQQALADFKAGVVRCLVATDIAARGLDIEDLSHVFNYNLPEVPETYVHRIGRTGRAGREGEAVAFCDFSEKPLLKDVEKLMGRSIPLIEGHPFPLQVFEGAKRDKNGKLINEEDAEARAAAKELRRTREQTKKTPAQAGPAPTSRPQADAQSDSRRRGRNKPAAGEHTAPSAPAQHAAPSDSPAPRGRGVRAGTLMDTGDAMPRTDLRRPNPMDSDVIMDATARMLSSRRIAPAVPQRTRSEEKSPRQALSRTKPKPAQKSEGRAAQTIQARQEKQPAKAVPVKAVGKSVPGTKRAHSRSGLPRSAPQEPRRKQTKDSTEQESLMKPYYLDYNR